MNPIRLKSLLYSYDERATAKSTDPIIYFSTAILTRPPNKDMLKTTAVQLYFTITASQSQAVPTQISCYPSSNKENNKPLDGKAFNFEVGEKNGKTWLCMREVGNTKQEDILCFPRGED